MSPLSLSPFRTGPYEIEPPENPDDAFDKEEYVEQWRAEREALVEAVELTESDTDKPLQKLCPPPPPPPAGITTWNSLVCPTQRFGIVCHIWMSGMPLESPLF
jgi:hypothetical protein